MSRYIAQTDALLSPVLKKPENVTIDTSSDKNGYYSGLAILYIKPDFSPGAVVHEYGHAYFAVNILAEDGRSLHENEKPWMTELKYISDKLKELRKKNPFSDNPEVETLVERRRVLLDYILPYKWKTKVQDELFADLVATMVTGDPDVIAHMAIKGAVEELKDRRIYSEAYVRGAHAHGIQRSFFGDPCCVLGNPEVLKFSPGVDPYSFLAATRYYLGTVMRRIGGIGDKQKLLVDVIGAIQTQLNQLNAQGKTITDLSYLEANTHLITLLEQRTGYKNTIEIQPKYYGDWESAPGAIINPILNNYNERRSKGPGCDSLLTPP